MFHVNKNVFVSFYVSSSLYLFKKCKYEMCVYVTFFPASFFHPSVFNCLIPCKRVILQTATLWLFSLIFASRIGIIHCVFLAFALSHHITSHHRHGLTVKWYSSLIWTIDFSQSFQMIKNGVTFEDRRVVSILNRDIIWF